jgi:hypothetical protein
MMIPQIWFPAENSDAIAEKSLRAGSSIRTAIQEVPTLATYSKNQQRPVLSQEGSDDPQIRFPAEIVMQSRRIL